MDVRACQERARIIRLKLIFIAPQIHAGFMSVEKVTMVLLSEAPDVSLQVIRVSRRDACSDWSSQ